MRTITLKLDPETIERLTYIAERGADEETGEGALSLDEAAARCVAGFYGRQKALDDHAAKVRQARRFEAGEVKKAPHFEARTNMFPKLVAKEDEPKKAAPAKVEPKKTAPKTSAPAAAKRVAAKVAKPAAARVAP